MYLNRLFLFYWLPSFNTKNKILSNLFPDPYVYRELPVCTILIQRNIIPNITDLALSFCF